MENSTLDWKIKQLKLYNIEIYTQKTILYKYMKSIQSNRSYEHDLLWIDKMEIKTKDKINKIHMRNLDNLLHKENKKKKTKDNIKNNMPLTIIIIIIKTHQTNPMS